MIKFFRKIRQNMISEGNTGKYLKYAIGEIILVVIGILIAANIKNLFLDTILINSITGYIIYPSVQLSSY